MSNEIFVLGEGGRGGYRRGYFLLHNLISKYIIVALRVFLVEESTKIAIVSICI